MDLDALASLIGIQQRSSCTFLFYSDDFEISTDWPEDQDLLTNINEHQESESEKCLDDNEELQEMSLSDDVDSDFHILPISIEMADEVCFKLNDLIQKGIISREKIFYKYLSDVCNIYYDRRSPYDPDVVEFFNTIKYLGGERTLNFIRGPMWHGTGKGGEKKIEESKMNLGGPSRTTLQNKSVGYTTKSGVNKTWLKTLFKLETDESTGSEPLISNTTLQVFPVSMQNDGTALKPGLEFDEQQLINVGLTEKVDISYVRKNPNPDPEFLKSHVITEANVTYLTTIDNSVSFPVSVTYLPKSGKTGTEMKEQFLSEIDVYQMCLGCIETTTPHEHIISAGDSKKCTSSCAECYRLRKVCSDCDKKKQVHYIPALRSCSNCLEKGQKCIRNIVLALSTDCEAGNKAALESIIQDRISDQLSNKYMFSCLPDAVHVGKSLKASFANWILLLGNERGCLSIIHNIREHFPPLKRILTKDAVMNKDRMDIDCILHLTKDSVIKELETVDRVIHSLVPDQFRISSSNKVGMYPHPIACTCGAYGKILMLDYQPMKKKSRLLEVKLHVPADVNILMECEDARSIAYMKGIVYICNFETSISMFQGKKPNVKNMKRDELEDLLKKRNLSTNGSVLQLRERLQKAMNKEESNHKKSGIDPNKVVLSEEVYPSCIATATESMLVVSSDVRKAFYLCELSHDGVIMRGDIRKLADYPTYCRAALCLSMKGNMLLCAYEGEPGGIIALNLARMETQIIVSNGTNDCKEAHGVAIIQENDFIFTDKEGHAVKRYHDETVECVAGTGKEGNDSGLADRGSFSQPMGICVEYGTNIYVTDAQCGCLKMITTIKNTIVFLKHLRMLYTAFSVHLKHTKVPKLSVTDARETVHTLTKYLREREAEVQNVIGVKKATNGPEGTVASKTVRSVEMITSELSHLLSVLSTCNQSEYSVDLQSLLTVQVENLHATSHFKEQFPTCLQYARLLSATVYESVKRSVNWSAYYFTHAQSYYPVPSTRRQLSAMPFMGHLSPTRTLSSGEKETMKNWASDYGKCVRQRTVRQETTKFKAGTLPLNMYQATVSQKHGNKVSFDSVPEETPEGILESSVANVAANMEDKESNVKEDEYDSDSSEYDIQDQSSEYDSDSSVDETNSNDDPPDSTVLDNTTAALDFMRAVTTRSGRAVKVSMRYK